MDTLNKPREFYTQLQGLRGIAVLFVIVSHFLIAPAFPAFGFLELGFWGVNIFFVLSGFLITEILLRDIYQGDGVKTTLRKFYFRRTLRIFPIYYLTLVLLYIFNVADTRAVAPYTFTYTVNLVNAYKSEFSIPVSHFWSLCVEEQFYLLWPLLLFVFRRWHLGLILFMIAIGVFNRAAFVTSGIIPPADVIWETTSCFDCLALGALLAWMKTTRPELLRRVLLRTYYIGIAAALACIFISYTFHKGTPIFAIWGRLLSGVAGFYLIGAGAVNLRSVFSKTFNSTGLAFFGNISYGLYVYHWIIYVLIADSLMDYVVKTFPGTLLQYNKHLVVFFVCVSLTVFIAYLSYKLIEVPIMRLRRPS